MADPELIIRITGNSAKFQAELKKIEAQSKASGDKMAQQAIREQDILERNLRASYRRIAIGLAAVTAGSALALGSFAKYETALTSVIRTTGLAGSELEKFKTGIDGISDRLATPREELLKIAEVAGSLGIQGAANLAKFTETMAKFDIASSTLKGEQAAVSIARIIQLTGGGVENVDRYASSIAKLADDFSSTEAQIASMAEEISMVNVTFPLSTQNTLGLASALATLGVSPEVARSGLLTFGTTLDTSLREGGDKLRLFTALTGMTEDQLRKTFKEAPEEVFVAFSEGLKSAGADAGFVLDQLGLNNLRVAPLLLTTANNIDVVGESLKVANQEYIDNNKLNSETQTSLETTAKKWDDLKVSVNKVIVEIGEKLAPAAEIGFRSLSSWFDVLYKDLNEDIPQAFQSLVYVARASFDVIAAVFAQMMAKFDMLIADFLSGIQNIGSKLGVNIDMSAKISGLEASALSSGLFANERLQAAANMYRTEEEMAQLHNESMAEIRAEDNVQELEQSAEHQAVKDEIAAEIARQEEEKAIEKREKDLEKRQSEFEEDMELLDERLQIAVDKQNNALVLDIANQKKALQEKAKIDGLKVKQTMEVSQAEMQLRQIAVADAIAGFQSMFKEGTVMSKALFLVGKAAAMAEAFVNTQQAYTKALAQTANPGYAQLIWAAGMLKVGAIGATAIQGISAAQDGGIVPGGFGGGDRVPMMLEPGEVIVPQRLNPLSPNFDQSFGGSGMGSQNVQVMIGLDEDASRVLTVKQREDSKLGIQS